MIITVLNSTDCRREPLAGLTKLAVIGDQSPEIVAYAQQAVAKQLPDPPLTRLPARRVTPEMRLSLQPASR
jgi:hypothetical protein